MKITLNIVGNNELHSKLFLATRKPLQLGCPILGTPGTMFKCVTAKFVTNHDTVHFHELWVVSLHSVYIYKIINLIKITQTYLESDRAVLQLSFLDYLRKFIM